MTSTWPHRKVRQLLSALDQAVERFRRLDVDLDRGRVAAYRRVLQKSSDGGSVSRDDLWTASLETVNLESAAALSDQHLEAVRHRLHLLSSGRPAYRADDKSDQGRDLMFELLTAAMLLRGGHAVTLDNPSDVRLDIADEPLLVECKRPSTDAALGRRLKEAYRQISEHRRAGATGAGAVAIDASVLVNPGRLIATGADREEQMRHMYQAIQYTLSRARKEVERALRSARPDADVRLWMIRFQCLAGDELSAPSAAEVWHLEPRLSLDSPEMAGIYRALNAHPSFTAPSERADLNPSKIKP